MKNIIGVIFAIIVLAGCTSVQRYEGAKRPNSEVSILLKEKKGNFLAGSQTVVNQINGKFRGIGTSDRFEFLPGKITLRVGLSGKGFTSTYSGSFIDIEFIAEAGKVYELRHSMSNTKWNTWVVEQKTQKTVSSYTVK